MPGCPANLYNSRATAYSAYSICELGLFGYIFCLLPFLLERPDTDLHTVYKGC